jgi:hypothetical protein
MAIDPSIALGYRGIEAPNPLNQFAQVQQLQANEMKMQEAMAANQERNALRRLDPAAADYENQLFKVNPQLGIQFRKERTASEASQAMAAQHKAEAAAKRAAFAAQGERDLARNPSNANITAWLEDTQASDLFTAQEKAAAAKQAESYLAMPVAKRAAAMQMRGASTSDYTSRGQLAVSQGQLKVAQDRLAQEGQAVTYQTDADGNTIALPTKVAPGVTPTARAVIAPGGGLQPLKAKDSSKTAVSEQQASYNIGRVLNAAKEIGGIVKKDPSALKPGGTEALASATGFSGTANAARNANRQIVYGAQRDALDALLYLATGAAYNKEQLEGQMAAYIPSFTDEPENVAAKQARMANLIQSAKTRAGKAWTPDMESAMQSLINPAGAAAAPATPAPKGVPADIWNNMTPEERKLWN